jgi:hypothetical protein
MQMQATQQHAPGGRDNRDERRANGPARAVSARESGPPEPYLGTGSVAVASAGDRLVVNA